MSRESDPQAITDALDAAKQLQPPGYALSARTSGDIAAGLEDLITRLTRFVILSAISP